MNQNACTAPIGNGATCGADCGPADPSPVDSHRISGFGADGRRYGFDAGRQILGSATVRCAKHRTAEYQQAEINLAADESNGYPTADSQATLRRLNGIS